MLFVIPVSLSDSQLVDGFVKNLVRCGRLTNHTALIVSAPSAASVAHTLYEGLRSVFINVDVHTFTRETPSGWPAGCNAYFRETVYFLEGPYNNTKHWYFFELDNTPIVEGWADRLEAEYQMCHKPYMGIKEPTKIKKDGVLGTDGYHMVGTGIYPPNLSPYSWLWKIDQSLPWDVFTQWEVLPHLHGTDLIQHNYLTENYRRDAFGAIICDARKSHRGETLDGFNQAVRKSAVVVHGCKDGSLAKLLCDEEEGNKEEVLDSLVDYEDGTPFAKVPKRRAKRKPTTA